MLEEPMMDNPDELLINEFFIKDRQLLLRLIRENKAPRVVYDIGAASGGWSGVVSAGLPPAEHHLFEPLPDHTQYSEKLEARLQRHPDWVLHPIALGDSNGTCVMSIGKNAANSTLTDMSAHPSLFVDRVEVPQWRLDDYVDANKLRLPDLIKMDTQASEHLIFAGGRRTIAAAQVLMIETWLYPEYGPSTPLLTDIITLASSLGFILFKFGDEFRHADGRLYGLDVVFTKPGFLDAAGS
jgi:FkbM family methyltransferase